MHKKKSANKKVIVKKSNMSPKEWLLDYARRKTRGQGAIFTTAVIKLFIAKLDDAKIVEMFGDVMKEDDYKPKVWKNCVHTQQIEVEFRINIANKAIDEYDVAQEFDYETLYYGGDDVEVLGTTEI